MELRQLKYFVAVAEERNFTRAAARCHVAQPSLSQQILNLEQELGERLFHRHPRRIELTEAGLQAYQQAREVIEKVGVFRDAFANRQALLEGSIQLGVIPTIAPYLLPPAITAFRTDHPQISIRLHEAKTPQLIDGLLAGQIDLAIASDLGESDRRRPSLQIQELFREPLLLALPEHHPLARNREALAVDGVPRESLILLREGHCLGDQVLRLCRSRRDTAPLECEQIESLLAMVRAGLGVAVVPAMAVKNRPLDQVICRRLGPPEPSRMISIITKRNQTLPRPAARFLKFILPI